MAFNLSTPKPTLSFGTPSTNNATGSSLFSGLGSKSMSSTPASTGNNPGGSLFLGIPQTQNNTASQSTNSNPFSQQTTAVNTNPNASSTMQPPSSTNNLNTSTLSSGAPQIDIAHLRSTTKYDHLTPQLQQEILALDTAILNQIRQCTDVSDLLPAVINAGSQTAPAIDFVSTKLDELETGLENDAEAVVALRDSDLQKGEGEAKCVFRTVDRLKVPRQYQVGGNVDIGAGGVGAGGGGAFNGGLLGWWNQSQTFRGSSVRAAGAGSSVQVVDQHLDEDKNKGPKDLLQLFDHRTNEMENTSHQQRRLLGEIEDFVYGLEEKLHTKERDLYERLDNGSDGEFNVLQQEKEQQMHLMRYVFGELERNLYDVAERVGLARDAVVDLGLR